MRQLILSLLALVGLSFPAFAQKSPEDTVKSMTVAEGLQVEVFAAEPMLINPTSMDVDHLGRVWVSEAVNYRRKGFGRPILRPEGDRIVILTDKDGDGKADESTVFYQGEDLYGPLGICILAQPSKEAKGGLAYRVLVCQSPDILEFWDKDGDGKADGKPTKFLTNFGGFDHDHGVHGINVGPDGKLYFTVGDSGVRGLQAADGKGPKWTTNDKDVQKGTVWRCDQDGKNLELIAHNFRNNYECCVNSFGEIWLSDNDDDGNQQTRICHVMPGGNYGYGPRGPGQTHWHEEQPGIVHKTLRTGFGSPTGICFYEGTLLPKKYHGQLLHTDAGPRELRAFHIKPKGAGYELDKEILVTASDTWFRLSDVCVAPDGSVMLADWYDPGVGGHGMGDWTRGRIYRVTPKGHKGYKVPEVKVDTKESMLGALASACQATRTLAILNLAQLNINDARTITRTGMSSKNLTLAARCSWQDYATFKRKKDDKGFEFSLPPEAVQSEHESLFYGLSLRARHVMQVYRPGLPEPDKFDAQIRREMLLNLSHEDTNDVVRIIGAFLKLYDGQDIFYRAALNIACGTDPARRDAILADFDKHFPEWNDKVADLVWELRPKSVLPRLSKLLADDKLTAAQKGRIVDILAVNDDPNAGKTMLTLLSSTAPAEVKTRAIDNLRLFLPTKWSALSTSPEMAKVVKDLLGDAKTRGTGLQLIAAAKYQGGRDDVLALAKDSTLDQAARVEAVRVLGQLRGMETLKGLIEIGQPENPLTIECVKAIGLMLPNTPKADNVGTLALESLQRAITTSKASFELKNAALSALAGNRYGTQFLLTAKEKNELPEELVADAGRLLRNSPFQGERNKAMLLFPAPGKLDPKKLPPISELAKRTGDAKRGEAVLAASLKGEAQCLRCHTVRGIGGNIGPDQSMVGKKASRENLLESILQPSKAIADQYVQWKVDTNDGKSITGLLVEENAKSLTLRDANGKDYTFPVAQVDKKTKSLISIMPDNLAAALTVDELIDMVEYLLTLKTPSLTPESWLVFGPMRSGNDVSHLDTVFAPEEKGFSIPMAGDTKEVRRNDAGYIDLAAHFGKASENSASYLYRVIESPVAQDAEILLGTDDGYALFVNGKQVAKENVTRAAAANQSKVKVKLNAGKNDILLKVANGNNPHGAYITLVAEQELKVGK